MRRVLANGIILTMDQDVGDADRGRPVFAVSPQRASFCAFHLDGSARTPLGPLQDLGPEVDAMRERTRKFWERA